jgi:hypothetical protein
MVGWQSDISVLLRGVRFVDDFSGRGGVAGGTALGDDGSMDVKVHQ